MNTEVMHCNRSFVTKNHLQLFPFSMDLTKEAPECKLPHDAVWQRYDDLVKCFSDIALRVSQ